MYSSRLSVLKGLRLSVLFSVVNDNEVTSKRLSLFAGFLPSGPIN